MPGFIQNYREVVNSVERRQVLIAMTGGQLLVQLSSLPVTLALPSIARDFGHGVDEAAWIVIANLLVLGSTVFLGARLGDRFGHPRVFFIGTIIITVGAVGIVAAQDLTQVTILRGLQGFGAGLIHGNGNAMLAFAFPPGERGRAYAFPITGSRVGTFIGVAFFGVLLQWADWDAFAGWRLVFLTMLPIGLIVIKSCMPVVRRNDEAIVDKENPIDYLGAILLVAVSAAFILSGSHIHGGEESYTSPDALTYHLPMHGLTIALLVVFIYVERRVAHPFVEFQHFKQKYFTLAIISNVMFHLSMMATMILVPIMIEEGLGKSPIFVTYVLLPHPVLWHLAAGHRGVHTRQVQPTAAANGLYAFHCVGVRVAGAVCRDGLHLVAAPPAVPDFGWHQHLQHGEQRYGDEHPANGEPGLRFRDAGDDPGHGARDGGNDFVLHRGHDRAGDHRSDAAGGVAAAAPRGLPGLGTDGGRDHDHRCHRRRLPPAIPAADHSSLRWRAAGAGRSCSGLTDGVLTLSY